ncbi:long-chain fatty acid--CoA ligase [Aliishimia ponticola]|uniref:Long-chain fatty acid--CoA ligase n=1 Tax=Aliishimia ponticola TaxID=2499833 RepID=A0A4S4NL35_9RHOB|nr:class I adenylate-forming enzyme family protein [Aliishimia ponticola]THH36870.1 long-chain fatty acid--CoA ligase [Aliishimia ponticola]
MSAFWHDFLLDQDRLRPEAPAFSDTTGAAWTWAETAKAARAAADHLRDLGVRPGDRVLLLAENSCSAIAFLYGASMCEAPVIPFNARQTEAELQRVFDHAEPAAIVMLSDVSPDAGAHAARMGATLISGPFGQVHTKALPGTPEDIRDVAVILYTTGTTGDPKGVMLTHANMRFGGQTSAKLRWMTPEDVIYAALPMTHVFGLASVATAATYIGAEARLESRFSAAKLATALTEGVTLLSAVPQMHALLMQYVKEQGLDRLEGGKLRYVSSGGAPLDPDWKRRAEAFYGVPLQNGYGMTETTAGIAATQHTEANDDISCGPALPGVEIEVAGGATEGELRTRGPHVMKGYFRAPDRTAEVLDADGWLSTGDIGTIDAEGRVTILGRSKELIIHGGFNVYPPEVEGVLSDHPQIIQAAVVGHVVEGDEKVLAFCQVAPGDTPDIAALQAWLAARLTGYKRPWKIVCADALPAAPTGKILKHKLKDAFAGQF